jgi:hypothetical protein
MGSARSDHRRDAGADPGAIQVPQGSHGCPATSQSPILGSASSSRCTRGHVGDNYKGAHGALWKSRGHRWAAHRCVLPSREARDRRSQTPCSARVICPLSIATNRIYRSSWRQMTWPALAYIRIIRESALRSRVSTGFRETPALTSSRFGAIGTPPGRPKPPTGSTDELRYRSSDGLRRTSCGTPTTPESVRP